MDVGLAPDIFELLIGAGLMLVVVLFLFVVKAFMDREEPDMGDEELVSDAQQHPMENPEGDEGLGVDWDEPSETETQRLKRIENELAEREKSAKEEKISQLKERERIIKMKEGESQSPPVKQEPSPDEDLIQEKERIRQLISKAEESYGRGELEEKNFKRIVSEYQQQIIDIDIKVKRHREGELIP